MPSLWQQQRWNTRASLKDSKTDNGSTFEGKVRRVAAPLVKMPGYQDATPLEAAFSGGIPRLHCVL